MNSSAETICQRIKTCCLLPIIRFKHIDQAEKIAAALLAAQVDIVEFPLTSAHALKAIEKVSAAFGDKMLVGAGTVLDGESARSCILAGARFIVSPVVKTDVIGICKRLSTVVCPGALTPTETLLAWEAGADFIKIFPCNSLGGASYIKSLKTPLPHIEMIPVGGVTPDTVSDFLEAGSAALGVGNGLLSQESLTTSNFEDVTKKALIFRAAILKARTKCYAQ
jgi:2-dehydro-3-deoxyphosphogluconate aldolase/(4S)-4-hydroxy-2-oxoglutarate aldolase